VESPQNYELQVNMLGLHFMSKKSQYKILMTRLNKEEANRHSILNLKYNCYISKTKINITQTLRIVLNDSVQYIFLLVFRPQLIKHNYFQ